jgi:MFS family permease
MIKSQKQILTLLGFGTAISLLGDATLYTVLPNPGIAAQVGVSLAKVGILLGANRAIRLLLNGPMGLLIDRLPRRGLLLSSLSLGTVANLSYVMGHGFWPMMIGRIIWGIAWSMLWITGNAVVLDISTDENRGKFSGQYQMWFAIGIAGSSFIGGLLTDLLGFRGAMWLTSGAIGATTLLWFFLLPETRKGPEPSAETKQPKKRAGKTPWKFVLIMSVPVFLSRFISWGILASTSILWLSTFIGDGLQLASMYIPLATMTGAFTAFTMLTNVGSAPLAGFLSDKIGRRWPILGAAALLGAIGIWLMSSTWLSLALVGALLAQITGGSTETLIPAIAGDRIDKTAHGRVLGIVYTFGDLGSMLGPVIALGLLNGEQISIQTIYQFSALLFFGMAVFSLLQSRKVKSSKNNAPLKH